MEFILGCNYWASNAGAEMWRDFNIECINKDIRLLSENGVKHIRAFPNWRDFQPVHPILTGGGVISGYTMSGKPSADNPYYLDEEMLRRFSAFLDVCDKYNIKVIVGIITGWMSGGLFVPPALYGHSVISSHLAQHLEQLFIKGFVERFRDRSAILAWDLGNECNCAGSVNSRWEVAGWVAMVSNAIRASDPTRPIISGMHELYVDGKKWTISDQTLFLDMLTTHPYPFWCKYTSNDEILSLRTTMHATAQTKLYADIGKKPCLAEEIGTMGPMICSDENAASFMRLNMFSLWANGASGVMWWCAHDQTELESFPYSVQMVERELGMMDTSYNPKPVLKEMKSFSAWLDNLDFELPSANTDAVCLLSRDQDHWGVAYMTHILSRQAGLNCKFAYADQGIPDSKLYIMPSINGVQILLKERYDELKQKVYDGADLYISLDNAILSEFEELCGLKVIDSFLHGESLSAELNGKKLNFYRTRNIITKPTTAKVLAYDSQNNPFISVNKYGKGRVFFVNAPVESNLLEKHNAFNGNTHSIYQELFKDYIEDHPISLEDKELIATYHPTNDGFIVVVLNHYADDKALRINGDNYKIDKFYYGDQNTVKAFDACVFKITKI